MNLLGLPKDVLNCILSLIVGCDRLSVMLVCSYTKRLGYGLYFPEQIHIERASYAGRDDMIYSLFMSDRVKCLTEDLYDTLMKWSTDRAHMPLINHLLSEKYDGFKNDVIFMWCRFEDEDTAALVLDAYQRNKRIDLTVYDFFLIRYLPFREDLLSILCRDEKVISYLNTRRCSEDYRLENLRKYMIDRGIRLDVKDDF